MSVMLSDEANCDVAPVQEPNFSLDTPARVLTYFHSENITVKAEKASRKGETSFPCGRCPTQPSGRDRASRGCGRGGGAGHANGGGRGGGGRGNGHGRRRTDFRWDRVNSKGGTALDKCKLDDGSWNLIQSWTGSMTPRLSARITLPRCIILRMLGSSLSPSRGARCF